MSAISITEEQIETHNDIEATFDFETLAIDEEKQVRYFKRTFDFFFQTLAYRYSRTPRCNQRFSSG